LASALPYLRLVSFLLPLVVTMVVAGMMPQFLAGGIARGLRPTQTLAAYALAWGMADFLASPMSQVRQLALVLVSSRRQALQVLRFVLSCGMLLAAILGLLALSSAGRYIVEDLHETSADLGRVVRLALLLLIPYPLLEALQSWMSGLLMRVRRTEVVSVGMLVGIGASLLTVFVAVPTPLVRELPIALPLLATYAGQLANMIVLVVGISRYVHPRLDDGSLGKGVGVDLSFRYLAKFFWPLALTMAIQGLSRPVINLFISRGLQGEQALAALAVVYSLAHLPYTWLNELRSLPAVFVEYGRAGLRRIRRFSGACGIMSFLLMVVAFWVPTVRDLLLLDLLAVPAAVAARCHVPLVLFSFFPPAVSVRGYLQGVALRQRRTSALAPSAPARIGAILAVLLLVPGTWWSGTTRGVAALLCGFVLEAFVIWYFVYLRRPIVLSRQKGEA